MRDNECSVWMKDSNECLTIYDDRATGCVGVEATDGFKFKDEGEVDQFAEELKAHISSLRTEEWCMGNL